MAEAKQPVTIKKYANRRLYDTGSSSYVTLEDLAAMVKKGEEFVVCDAKTGEDITRNVLTQIIFEQEAKEGQSMLPVTFLRQLISFYGDRMQMLVPCYLEYSIDKLSAEQQRLREQMTGLLGSGAEPQKLIGVMEEQAKKNMAMFSQALSMFNPFAASAIAKASSSMAASDSATNADAATSEATEKPSGSELDEMRKQLAEMQAKIEGLTTKK